MVVLAAGICTRDGKVLISRQFLPMSRSHIEGLLMAFPKLIGSETSREHTLLVHDGVRFVYQPLESMFMVLVTNLNSNILQDIETVRLFGRVVGENCRNLEEKEILKKGFELLYTFDEIISMGYKENLNSNQIRTIIEMDSYEEKIQEAIAKNKEQEAKEDMKKKIKQLEMQKRENSRKGGGLSPSYLTSFAQSAGFKKLPVAGESSQPTTTEPTYSLAQSAASSNPAAAVKGMQLGMKPKAANYFDALKSEEGFVDTAPTITSSKVSVPIVSSVPRESVHLISEEKVSVRANRDGGLDSMEVKGELALQISDPAKAQIKILLKPIESPDLQTKTHPNVDKKMFGAENALASKDPSKPFPTNQSLGILKWRFITKDESMIPLSINCWPTPTGEGSTDVNIEYELEMKDHELKNVIISIPLPPSATPKVGDVDGHYTYQRQRNRLDWEIPIIDEANSTGSLEFNCVGEDVNVYFPIDVSFACDDIFCDIEVEKIIDSQGESVTFSQETRAFAEGYQIA